MDRIRQGRDAMQPDDWMHPVAFTCLAALPVLVGDLLLVSSRILGRHALAETFVNRRLLLVLVVATAVWLGVERLTSLRPLKGAGLALASLGLAGRGLVEIGMIGLGRWPASLYQPEVVVPPMVAATRWIGLAAVAVGLTLFAVEIAGWWVDRRRQRR